jgi:hypothetical protein
MAIPRLSVDAMKLTNRWLLASPSKVPFYVIGQPSATLAGMLRTLVTAPQISSVKGDHQRPAPCDVRRARRPAIPIESDFQGGSSPTTREVLRNV